jgi:hypothetical protein
MKTRATMLFWGGMLAVGFAVGPASEEEGARAAPVVVRTDRPPRKRDVPLTALRSTGSSEAVITLGPLEPPLLPPRVRVTNDRSDTVTVFYVVEGMGMWRRLGSVSGMATETFQVPEDLGTVRFALAPAGEQAPFVTGWIRMDARTDVAVHAAEDIARSLVTVQVLRVVREDPGR